MKNPTPAHRLTNIDLEHRTADCSVCGRIEIYVGPQVKNGVIRRVCLNKLRESGQNYTKRIRKEKGLPEQLPTPRHLLSQIDSKKMRAICSICGDTDIGVRYDQGKYKYYYCNTRMRERTAAYRRSKGIPPLNSSYHRLSNINMNKRTAVCSKCGQVKIYVVRQGAKYKSRCSNAHREQVVP